MKPVRILHVVSIMNRGGIETLLMNLFRNIDRSRVQFDFLVHRPEKGDYDDEIHALGGQIYQIPYVSKVGHFRYVKALNGFFKQHQGYGIVHSHINMISGLILRAARRYGIPVRISHSHISQPSYGFLEGIYKNRVKSLIGKNATDFFACSHNAGEWLFGKSIAKEKVVILKNGVELDRFHTGMEAADRILKELGLSRDRFIIGHVGRFDEQKNHTFLLDIFFEVHKQRPEAVLLLAGTGKLKPAMEEKANRMGLSGCVRFLGIRKDIPGLMSVFDLLLFPSLYEGLPVTLIEAQAAGLPCILSDTVSKESDIGAGLLHFISLGLPAAEWAEAVLSAPKCSMDTHAALREKGYDIVQTAAWLQEFYIKKWGEENAADLDRIYAYI